MHDCMCLHIDQIPFAADVTAVQTCLLWSGPSSVVQYPKSLHSTSGVFRNHSWACRQRSQPQHIVTLGKGANGALMHTGGRKSLRGFDVELVFGTASIHVTQHAKALLAHMEHFLHADAGQEHWASMSTFHFPFLCRM